MTLTIAIDTREQHPLTFSGIDTIVQTIDVGDYMAVYDNHVFPTRVERKSIPDLFTSFTHNYNNEREKILKAKELSLNYILAIEGPCTDIRRGHAYLKDGEWVESGKSGLAMVRQLMKISIKYGVEVWYCMTRSEMAFRIKEYFLAHKRFYDDERKAEAVPSKNPS